MKLGFGKTRESEEDGADGDGFDADRMGGLLCISQFVCPNRFNAFSRACLTIANPSSNVIFNNRWPQT
jgi:hypothetical protein